MTQVLKNCQITALTHKTIECTSVTFKYFCSMEERLDKLLVEKGLAETRTEAEQFIRERGVKINGKLISKPGKKFPIDCSIELIKDNHDWLTISAVKIEKAIKKWSLPISNSILLDLGAGKGGSTEVLIKHGAQKVYSVDSDSSLLDKSLSSNEVVVDLSGKFARELTNNLITDTCQGCIIEINHLSVEKIFPFIHSFLEEGAFVVAIVNPAYEHTKEHFNKDGFVKNKKLIPHMMNSIKETALINSLDFVDSFESPIIGYGGNLEYICLFRKVAN